MSNVNEIQVVYALIGKSICFRTKVKRKKLIEEIQPTKEHDEEKDETVKIKIFLQEIANWLVQRKLACYNQQ